MRPSRLCQSVTPTGTQGNVLSAQQTCTFYHSALDQQATKSSAADINLADGQDA